MNTNMYYDKDPIEQSYDELKNHSINLVKTFCKINNIEPISSINFKNIKKSDYTGMYWFVEKKIDIVENRIIKPTKIPGYKWSYPGYKADKTIIGVLAHETGHHVDNCLNLLKENEPKLDFIFLCSKISSYEPDKREAFAETIRLFITNPDLLKIYSPERYIVLTEYFGFKPVITDKWDKVLQYANEKYFNAINRVLKKTKK